MLPIKSIKKKKAVIYSQSLSLRCRSTARSTALSGAGHTHTAAASMAGADTTWEPAEAPRPRRELPPAGRGSPFTAGAAVAR